MLIDAGTVAVMAAIFGSLFGIVNPLGNVVIYITLTAGFTEEEKLLVNRKSITIATIVLIIFGLIGNWIFMLFGITIEAFQIAGGILIFSIGFSMLHAKHPRTKHSEYEMMDAQEKEVIGITPLGVPLYAGPGAITTVMLFLSRDYGSTSFETFIIKVWVFVSVLIIMGISYTTMKYSDRIFRYFGRSGLMAFSRIMGLIITAIAVEFVLGGIHSVLMEWGVI